MQICLNETEIDEGYEYDFNEIVGADVDIEAIEANPERYLNYKPVDFLEQLRADIDYLLEVVE